MFKALKKSSGQKNPGKKGPSPKNLKDYPYGEPSQNEYVIVEPYAQSNHSPPMPERPAPRPPTMRDKATGTLDKAWRTLEWNKRKPMKDELRKLKTSISDVAKLRVLVHDPVGAGKSTYLISRGGNKRKNMKNELRNLKISTSSVKQLRILVHGPVGAGKSSFINSIDSIFQERMTSGTIADAVTDRSFTKTFQTHLIKDQSYTSFLPFAFCDIMGLEAEHGEGVHTEDLVKVLKGHIKDGYTFNPISSCPETDPRYNSSPKLSDRIHCLVSVIPANHVTRMDDDVFSKMKAVRAKAGGIPQVTVLTKVDEVCAEVANDIKQVYMNKKIKEKMQECSNKLGIPMNCIFPVKCYHEEIQLNNDVDVLLLSALTTILHYANDHIAVLAKAPADSHVRDMAPPPANPRDGRNPYYENTPPPVPPRPRNLR